MSCYYFCSIFIYIQLFTLALWLLCAYNYINLLIIPKKRGFIYGIAGLSTNLSTINVVNDVQVAVLRQSLDTLETPGDSLTKMMEASVNPELGQNIDIRI